ncbi:hypothetical protein DSM112329_00785 [Paraconexibacter sp. AEG42_29]|uniref:Uncharacterized protein n=1 Tax=Paraconexibacter sp. AEG42_29 TaxID=2997339 RepID=A0AAU7AQJ0_9ACTN
MSGIGNSGRAADADERVVVARPRPVVRRPSSRGAVRTGSDAGLALVGITVVLCVAGWLVGGAVGVPIFGAMVGGLAGVIVGFAAVYVRFRDL